MAGGGAPVEKEKLDIGIYFFSINYFFKIIYSKNLHCLCNTVAIKSSSPSKRDP